MNPFERRPGQGYDPFTEEPEIEEPLSPREGGNAQQPGSNDRGGRGGPGIGSGGANRSRFGANGFFGGQGMGRGGASTFRAATHPGGQGMGRGSGSAFSAAMHPGIGGARFDAPSFGARGGMHGMDHSAFLARGGFRGSSRGGRPRGGRPRRPRHFSIPSNLGEDGFIDGLAGRIPIEILQEFMDEVEDSLHPLELEDLMRELQSQGIPLVHFLYKEFTGRVPFSE